MTIGRQRSRTNNGLLGTLTGGLGWFSLGLGVSQIVAPDRIIEMTGVPKNDTSRLLMRVVGGREIASGLGILTSANPAPWLWSRVGGDVMDLTLLCASLRSRRAQRDKVAATMMSVAGIFVLDLLTSIKSSRRFGSTARGEERFRAMGRTGGAGPEQALKVHKSITVNRPVDEVYAFWRDFQNLPRFMTQLEEVKPVGDGRWHWVAKGPLDRKIEWDTQIVEERPNQLIAWRSLPGSDIDVAATVRFTPAPGGRGTEVWVELDYSPPGGAVVAKLAKLLPENPERQLQDNLRAFKQVMETGEIVWSEATVAGGRIRQHPAQPPESLPGR